MSDQAPRSALEIAMERLRQKDAQDSVEHRPRTEQQKGAIAEVRSVYDAKLAQADVMRRSPLPGTSTRPRARPSRRSINATASGSSPNATRRSNGFVTKTWRPEVSLPRIVGVFAALVLSVAPAYADGFVTPFLGYNFGGDSGNCVSLTDCQEKHVNVGLSIGSTGRVVGLEQDITYARDFFGAGTDNSVLTVMTNLLITIPLGPIQPYVGGGVGLIRPHASYNPLQVVTSKSAFGSNFGGGLTLMFGQRVGVRGDIRRFHTLQDVTLFVFSGEKLDFWRVSAGITFRH